MAEAQKDTIYIDIDDEITAIIDKLQGSASKVVALVLPKRATALQSIVNMKLLKRASDQAGKNLVLITSETGLLPLAGAVGLHVAPTPTSRPEIPASPTADGSAAEQVDELDFDDDDSEPLMIDTSDTSRPIGDLAAASEAASPQPPTDNGVETLELDNTAAATEAATAAPSAKKAKAAKPKKDKKLAVPNFKKFKLLLALGAGLLVLLIVGGYLALFVLPKATISVKTNASNINTDVDFNLTTAEDTFEAEDKAVPAKRVETQKTLTGTSAATGQRNNGAKASGNITISVCTNTPNAVTRIPSGTGVSSSSRTYITQENADFQYAGTCSNGFRFRADDVTVAAQTGGAAFNTGNNASFSISGRSDTTASGSATGGTDDIQTIVSQADINSATAKIAAGATSEVRDELKDKLEDDGQYAITATFNAGTPATTTSANVGSEAGNVTVTQTITYSMLGADIANIRSLVDADIKGQIDDKSQSILNQGIVEDSFKLGEFNTDGAAMNIQTTAIVGPALDTDTIKQQASGKQANEIKTSVSETTGVTDVEVKLSPFWVSKAPKNADKITVTIAKPTNNQSNQ